MKTKLCFTFVLVVSVSFLLGLYYLTAYATTTLTIANTADTDYIGVDIGPSHIQQATPGQILAYYHTLTNTGSLTETFLVEVSSSQGWPVKLLGGLYPTGTMLLPLTVGAQMAVPFQVSLTVPVSVVWGTEITVITATSQTSSTVRDVTTDTSIVPSRIYLPVIFNRWPPIPYKPSLTSIQDAEDGQYTVSWVELPSRLTVTYTLQEAADTAFTSSVREVCTTMQESCVVQQTVVGTYYYRVRGLNDWGYGEWSDVQVVSVPIRGGVFVDARNRQESLTFFNQSYLSSEGIPINWTGNHGTCDAGSTDPNFRNAVLRRINYFRAMAGVPADVAFSDESNRKAQAAALMMSVNRQLSHTPPSSWICYSADGAEGAGSSNLYLGVYSWNAITGYIQDPGGGNYPIGHRRWILYPQTQIMGTGDIPPTQGYLASNALRVFDSHMWEPRPPTREEFVAWPPPGYVPYQVMFPRWSFSYASADFSAALVSMISNGTGLSVSQANVVYGYGENTLVWIPMGLNDGDGWPHPEGDTTYTVNIRNVIINGQSRDFTYNVVVFDPTSESVGGQTWMDLQGEWVPY